MAIIGPRISTSKFSFDARNASFVTEISDLMFAFGRRAPWGQLYDDACDEGLVLVSAATGKEVPFYLDGADERDGEICGWRFKPVDSKLHFRLLIIND